MRFIFLILGVFFISFSGLSQEIIILDERKNPIPNVSGFNLLKTKSTLSNREGIINLSRFLLTDTICFQHPNYKFIKILKKDISGVISLETNYNLLDGVVLSETKNSNNIKNTAEKKIYITDVEIRELSTSTTAELLEKKGGVSVQKSQMGGGSPNIRGFEANKVLLMIDGVRLNNAIYRSGHLQNIITIDEYILEDIEVIFGPSSVLFGSDALGGSVNMKTKEIYFRSEPKWKGNIFSNYNSAYNGFKNNFSISFESNKYSSITAVSFKKFGDLKMGSYRPHGYQDWGLVHHYINEADEIVCNPDPEIQKGTAYTQYDFFNKMIIKTSENSRITSNIQYSTSSNIPRFDKLNDDDGMCLFDSSGVCENGENLKFHSYYYGPQERFFSSFQFTLFEHYFDKSDIIFAYQKVKESRHKWYLDNFLTFDPEEDVDSELDQLNQYESVDVYSLNMNIRSGDFFFGSETIYNNVFSDTKNNTNESAIEDTRYPSDGSNLFSTAFYVNMLKRISHKFQVEGGARYTFSSLNGFYPEKFGGFDYIDLLNDTTLLKNNIISGNMKFVYYPSDSWKISSVTARGFHAPNVDDMFKVFRKGDNLTVPFKELNPEYSLSQEFSITKELSRNITLYGVGFYTQLTDAIVKDTLWYDINPEPTEEYLMSTMPYDGEVVTLFANQNADKKVHIYGFTLGMDASIMGFKINQDVNITKGINRDISQGPFAHIPPVFGKLEVLKNIDKWSFRFICLYAGEKKSSDFDYAGVDNIDETPLIGFDENGDEIWAGSPSWYTLNFSVKHQFNQNTNIQFGVDNLLDTHYKTFGSGISAPGRNIVLSGQYNF